MPAIKVSIRVISEKLGTCVSVPLYAVEFLQYELDAFSSSAILNDSVLSLFSNPSF
jgi:hypothetical protein